jgi:hypothetical protein
MLQVAFALLMAVGVWAAWRGNPLYSTKSTLRFVAVVGAMALTVVAAVVAVADAAPKLPTAVAVAAIGAIAFFGMLLLIWTIMVLTSPRVPPLPPGAQAVYLHRAKVGRWARRLVIALVGFGIGAAVLRGDLQILVAAFGGLTAFLGMTMLFAGYIAADRMDKSLAAMEADPWVHWSYSPAQWQAWSAAETERLASAPPQFVWRRDWKRSLWVVVPTIALVSIFDPGDWLWKAGYLCALLVLGIVIIEGSNWSVKNAPHRLRALLMSATPESYLGSAGVFSDGTYTEWLTVSNYLIEATIDERAPRSVVLRFEVIQANGLAVQATRHVLIPDRPGEDLARLQQLLSARCPSANVSLMTPMREETTAAAV